MKTTYIINAKYINPNGFDYILFSLSKDFINNEGVRVLRTLFNGCLALPFKATNKAIATVINIDEVDIDNINWVIDRIKTELEYTASADFIINVANKTEELIITLQRKVKQNG